LCDKNKFVFGIDFFFSWLNLPHIASQISKGKYLDKWSPHIATRISNGKFFDKWSPPLAYSIPNQCGKISWQSIPLHINLAPKSVKENLLFFFYKFLIFNLTPNGCENRTFLKRHTPTFFHIFCQNRAFFFLTYRYLKILPQKSLGDDKNSWNSAKTALFSAYEFFISEKKNVSRFWLRNKLFFKGQILKLRFKNVFFGEGGQ
jgi:hypothetical protein